MPGRHTLLGMNCVATGPSYVFRCAVSAAHILFYKRIKYYRNAVVDYAQKFETAFYAKPDLRNVRPPEEPAKSEPATLNLESLVEQLQKSPELASALAALIAAQAPAK